MTEAGREADVSVVICCYTEARWLDLVDAVGSLRDQTAAPREVIVVVDHNAELARRARAELAGVSVVENVGRSGLSGARNTGVSHSSGSIVAFLDDDALADPSWIASLARAYDDPRVLGTAGTVAPRWATARPRWFPEEFGWVVGCSYRGLPRRRAAVRNPIGANMSARADVLRAVGGFSSELGRVGTIPLGAEETELFVRVGKRYQAGIVLYDPDVRVSHRVTGARATVRYFLRRCFAEGLSKARMARVGGADRSLGTELRYTTVTLPSGVLRGLGQLARGDVSGVARAAMIVAGFATTLVGFIAGRLDPRFGT